MKPWRRLWFIRHAETDLAGTFCGSLDPPLNERGRAQLPGLVERMQAASLSAIYSSVLCRATETAEALAAGRSLSVQTRSGLRELGFGSWEGLTWEQIETRDPAYAQRWVAEFPALPTPGGEPIGCFRGRVLAELDELSAAGDGDLAVVTHAAVLRVLLEQHGHFSPHHAWERTRDYTCVIACAQGSPGGPLEVLT